jgi:hypothetical protein
MKRPTAKKKSGLRRVTVTLSRLVVQEARVEVEVLEGQESYFWKDPAAALEMVRALSGRLEWDSTGMQSFQVKAWGPSPNEGRRPPVLRVSYADSNGSRATPLPVGEELGRG